MGCRWKYLDQLRRQRRYGPALTFIDDAVDGHCLPPGSDMALAFVYHLAGPQVARVIRGQVELVELTQEDDPFAAFHGLI